MRQSNNLTVFPNKAVTVGKHQFTKGAIGALANPGVVQSFMQDKKSAEFVGLMDALPMDVQAMVLASHNAVWFLALNGLSQDVIRWLQPMSSQYKALVLDAGMGLEALLQHNQSDTVLGFMKELQSDEQARLLSKKYIIQRYLSVTPELSGRVFDLIATMSPTQQTQVLEGSEVVSSLSKQGLALDVFHIIAQLDANQKARIHIAKGYNDVKSYCSRRQADRQPPLRSVRKTLEVVSGAITRTSELDVVLTHERA